MGKTPSGAKHRVDILIEPHLLPAMAPSKKGASKSPGIISCKYQNSRGSAEEKLPLEILKLEGALKERYIVWAVVVTGGDGWSPGVLKHAESLVKNNNKIEIIDIGAFEKRIDEMDV